MKKMKSFKKPKLLFLLLFIVMSGSGFLSCKKLDEHVYTSETTSNFFQTKDQVMSSYVQPYAFLATHIYQVHFALSEFATDEAVAPERNGYLDQNGMWNRLHQHNWVVNDAWILTEWNDMYQAIGYANYFIDAVQAKDFTNLGLPIPKAQMVAEMKLVRDLHYYWLLDEFGNVPIVEHVGTLSPPTSSRADVYNFLVNDIKTNLPLLGHKGDATWYGHFTQEAAEALLAKLYLNAKVFTGTDQYAACITECQALISSGKFSLDTAWNTPFLAHNEGSNENILVVPFDVSSQPNFDAGQQQVHWDEGPPKYNIGDSWYKVVSQQSFYNLYAANDYRINQWLVGPQTYIDAQWCRSAGDRRRWQPVNFISSYTGPGNQGGGSYDGVSNVKYQLEPTGSFI